MDGLLIDSEDLYTICTNEVLHEYGRPSLPWNIKAQLQGRPGPEAGKIFEEWAQLPISREEVMVKIQALQRKHFPNTQPLPGVRDLLTTLHNTRSPHVNIALATSSHAGNFALKTAHLEELFDVFAPEHRVLGDDTRIPLGRGKPAPDIYLLALDTVNERLRKEGTSEQDLIKPEECLVFEDSVPGVEAGRRAGMQVVWCPHPGLLNEYKGREREVLAGLCGMSATSEGMGVVRVLDDAWARLFASLEDFPYADYGINV